jgi:tRNA-specific 2-thiouridylase
VNNSNRKVIVGLSGGVDSSVAALLLQQQGYIVEGLFMKNWEEDDQANHCSAAEDLKDVEQVCDKLHIKLHTVNFSSEYWDDVFTYFLAEYKQGRTPNPDVLCNKEVKFKAFLNYALDLNANYIATGHYAGIKYINNTYRLTKALDLNKDQSYFLYTLQQDQLAKTLFPLASITKPEIRSLAKRAGLITYNKKDSTGICFIGERKFKDFLQRYLPPIPGDIVTIDGIILGQHDGLMYHTIGQRQGLKIGGQTNFSNHAWYVAKKNLLNNQLIVVQDKNNPLLFATGLTATNLSWINNPPTTTVKLTCKIRYRQEDSKCEITQLNTNTCQVTFTHPQRAVTPGQSIVFYQDDFCLGGGIIETAVDSKIKI